MDKKIILRIFCVGVLFLLTATLYGCSGGGSGSSTFASGYKSETDNVPGDSVPGDTDPGDGDDDTLPPTVTTHNPEPSSILLLTSGLVGIAVSAARRRRKSYKK